MKKPSEQSAILHDAYFNKPPCLTRLFLVRLILVCGLSVSGILAVSDLYLADTDMVMVCAVTASVSVVFYILASLFPSWAVYLLSFGGYGALFLNDSLRDKLSFFRDWFVLRIHSRLLKTESFTFHSLEKLRNGFYEEELAEGVLTGFILLGVLMAMLFVLSSRTRFRAFYALLVFIVPVVPAFGSEIAGYHHSVAIFTAFFFALYAVRMAYELDGVLVFGKSSIANDALHRNERSYRKRTAFSFLGRKLKSDIPRYMKYSGNAVIAIIVTGGIMLSSAVIIPKGTTFDYEEIFSGVKDIGYSIGEKFEEIFGISLGTGRATDDYFSYSSYGDNSGGIGISKPSDSERPVLDVVLERNDIPVYLRGDIGVEFSGTDWSAVRDEYNNYGTGYWQSLEEFYPEASYQIARQKLSSVGYMPDYFLPLQKVSVSYRRKSDVVFNPLAPFDLNYKESEYYDSFGDTVYRMNGGGYFNTIDTLALTPDMNFEALRSFFSEIAMSERNWTVPGWNYDEYRTALSDYEQYIKEAYRKTDSAIVEQLISELRTGGYIGSLSSLEEVEGVCRYFKDNFSYSLTADNGEGSEVLSNFLYNTKEGHCALFATATVLALRELGYNARYVTGYVVSGEGEKTAEGYKYTLREKDLHAWVEVYFYHVGWLPFDPTASVSGYAEYISGVEAAEGTTEAELTTVSEFNTESGFAPEEVESSLSEDAELPPEIVSSAESTTIVPNMTGEGEELITPAEPEKESILPLIITILSVIAAVTAAVVAVYLFVKKVNNAEKRTFSGFRKKSPSRAVSEMYKFCMFILEKEGLSPGCEMMPDFAQRVDASIFLKGSNVFMMDVIEVFSKTEFGNPEISPVAEEERASVYKFTSVVYRKYMENRSGLGRFISKISLFL